MVQANLLAAQRRLPDAPQPAVFNVGRGRQTSLNQIIGLLRELVERPVAVRYAPSRRGDIKHSVADISRAREILGFTPQTSIDDGLRQTLAWMQTRQALMPV